MEFWLAVTPMLERAHRPLDRRPVQRRETRADAERAAAELLGGGRENRDFGIVLLRRDFSGGADWRRSRERPCAPSASDIAVGQSAEAFFAAQLPGAVAGRAYPPAASSRRPSSRNGSCIVDLHRLRRRLQLSPRAPANRGRNPGSRRDWWRCGGCFCRRNALIDDMGNGGRKT